MQKQTQTFKVFKGMILFVGVLLVMTASNHQCASKGMTDKDFSMPGSSNLSLNGLQYNWFGYVNGPSNIYSGSEVYQHLNGAIYRVNETRWTGFPLRTYYNTRDVNGSNRYFNESTTWWGGHGHDFVWINDNAKLNDVIPIAMFLDGDHNFTVSSAQVISHNSKLYDCWKLTDSSGGFGYYEKLSGLLINATFKFMGGNIFHIELSSTNHVFPSNNNAPVLTSGKVDKYNTNSTHEFEFTVNYSDADNNFPSVINVIINSTIYSMEKVNMSENNYTMGVKYRYRTYLLPGNYRFFFNASDSLFTARFPTSTNITNLTVTSVNTHAPQLRNGVHITDEGYNDTFVVFSTSYKDQDNNAPKSVNVLIDGTGNYTLLATNLTKNNYMVDVSFQRAIRLGGGYHSYYFTCKDNSFSTRLPSAGSFPRFKIYNRTLHGSEIAWVSSHGEGSNSTYTQFLTLTKNLGATYKNIATSLNVTLLNDVQIIAINEGGSSLATNELAVLNTWVYNGGGLLVLGDNQDAGQVSLAQFFHLGLSSIAGSTSASSNLNFSHVLSNGVSMVNFQSSPQHTLNMALSETDWQWVVNTSDGRTVIAVKRIGEGKIVWVSDEIFSNAYITMANNFQLANNTLVWINLLKPNTHAPTFSSSNHIPASGTCAIQYAFNVTYADADGNGPVFVQLVINSTSYSMQKVNSSDFNYQSGVIYRKVLFLQPGIYVHYFTASDGKFSVRTPSSGNLSGPTVTLVNNYAPVIGNGTVDHATGYNSTVFKFSANYTDMDNNMPLYMRVVLNSTIYTMTKENASDFNVIDSIKYIFNIYLNPGHYSYHFEASDGSHVTRLPAVGEYTDITVIKAPLGGKNVGWVRSHGENDNSTYGQFMQGFADLGGNVSDIVTVISPALLSKYKVLVLSEGGTAWTIAENNALYSWILDKGMLIILGDNADASQTSVSSKFDVHYKTGVISSGNTTFIHPYHPAMSSIQRVYLPNPIRAIDLQTSTKYIVSLFNSTNNFVIGATLELGAGRIFWITDEVLTDMCIDVANNSKLASNLYQSVSINRRNDCTPTLANVTINPATGTQADTFVIEIDYKDVNNAAPASIFVRLNGTTFSLYKKDQVSWNYSLGVRYKTSIVLSPGNYYYQFNASNGFNSTKYPSSGSLGPLHVSYLNQYAPSLSNLKLGTRVISSGSLIRINITYKDIDNNMPVQFTFNAGNKQFNFTRVGGSSNYIAGVPFTCNVSLGVGLYNWTISVNDGLYENLQSSNATMRIRVISESKLSAKYIGWIVTHGETNIYQYGRWLDFARALGATVEIIADPVDQVDLSRYLAIVIQEKGSSWTTGELNKIMNWTSNGGTILVIGDENYPSITQISKSLNIFYAFSILAEENTSKIDTQQFLTSLSGKIYLPGPFAYLNTENSSKDLVTLVKTEAGQTIVATMNFSRGKVLWISDEILSDSAITEADNENFGRMVWEWVTTIHQSDNNPQPNPIGLNEIIIIVVVLVAIIGVVSILSVRAKKKKALKGSKVPASKIRDDLTDTSALSFRSPETSHTTAVVQPPALISTPSANPLTQSLPDAIMFCPTCNKRSNAPLPVNLGAVVCDVCKAPLLRIISCPNCKGEMIISKEFYGQYQDNQITCSTCNNSILLKFE
jgi:hypothetical protein